MDPIAVTDLAQQVLMAPALAPAGVIDVVNEKIDATTVLVRGSITLVVLVMIVIGVVKARMTLASVIVAFLAGALVIWLGVGGGLETIAGWFGAEFSA